MSETNWKGLLISLYLWRAILISAIVLAIFGAAPPGYAYTLSPQIDDTYINQRFNSTNYCTDTVLYVGLGPTSQAYRSIIYFNLSELPLGSTVESAVLNLSIISSPQNSMDIYIYRLTRQVSVNTTTWLSPGIGLWTAPGGDFYATPVNYTRATANGAYEFDIRGYLQNVSDEVVQNYGLLLVGYEASGTENKIIRSSEYSLAASRPNLSISYTPNAAPVIGSLGSIPLKANVSSNITLALNWTDLDSEEARAYFCNSSEFDNASGCLGRKFCEAALSAGGELSCNYTVRDSDQSPTQVFAYVCDSLDACTESQFNFSVNHLPTVRVMSPNGGEELNQDTFGSHTIRVTVNDSDADSVNISLYYSGVAGSRQNLITMLNTATAPGCTGGGDIRTGLNCTYSWNTSGIGGTYYLDAFASDGMAVALDYSDSTFDVTTVIDDVAPSISNESIQARIVEGEPIEINATVIDGHLARAWAVISNSTTNISTVFLSYISGNIYGANITGYWSGNYSFTVYANDTFTNLNNGRQPVPFNVEEPSASISNVSFNRQASPLGVFVVRTTVEAGDYLSNAYLSIGLSGNFSFLSGYSRNLSLGNISSGIATFEHVLVAPESEGMYPFNVTLTSFHNNVWTYQAGSVNVTSETANGYSQGLFLTLGTTGKYMIGDNATINARCEDLSGRGIANATVRLSIIAPNNSLVLASGAMQSTGGGNYSYNLSLDSLGNISASSPGNYMLIAEASYAGMSRTAFGTIQAAEPGVSVNIEAEPEVPLGSVFDARIYVRNSAGQMIDADSLAITLIDSLGNTIAANVSYASRLSTGIYTYNFSTSGSMAEGTWSLSAVASLRNTSYQAQSFWHLVGGPFDVKDVNILNNAKDSLKATVTLVNTGGVGRDMTVVWNLTRTDTGSMLDNGADTLLVPAYSSVIYTVEPSTDYAGNARIAFLGYYSYTETAGAYKNFQIIEGGGGNVTPVTPPAQAPSGGGGGGGGGYGKKYATAPVQPKSETFDATISQIGGDIKAVPGSSVNITADISNFASRSYTGIKTSLVGNTRFAVQYLSSTQFDLAAHESRKLMFRVGVPDDALPGDYIFIIAAEWQGQEERRTITITVIEKKAQEAGMVPVAGLGDIGRQLTEIKGSIAELRDYLFSFARLTDIKIFIIMLLLIAVISVIFALNYAQMKRALSRYADKRDAERVRDLEYMRKRLEASYAGESDKGYGHITRNRIYQPSPVQLSPLSASSQSVASAPASMPHLPSMPELPNLQAYPSGTKRQILDEIESIRVRLR